MTDERVSEIISVECLRVPAEELTPEKIKKKTEERTMDNPPRRS